VKLWQYQIIVSGLLIESFDGIARKEKKGAIEPYQYIISKLFWSYSSYPNGICKILNYSDFFLIPKCCVELLTLGTSDSEYVPLQDSYDSMASVLSI